MKKIYILGIILAIVVLGALVLNSTTGLFSLSNPGEIKIGVVATITGVGAYSGQQELRGLQLAQDEINANGGINGKQIKLIIEDSKTDAKEAVLAVNKLINVDNVKYIIGDSWSTTTNNIVSITNENNVILFSPVAILDSLSKDDYFFRNIPNINSMMSPLAKYIYDQNVRTVVILRQDTPFGLEHANDFKSEFEQLGGKIVLEEKFSLTETDFKTEIAKIRELNPDAIFNLHATGPMIGVLAKQLKENNIGALMFGSFGSENGKLIQEYGNEVNNLIYPYPYVLNEDNNNYFQKYNELPDSIAANSYDGLMILVKAIEKGNSVDDVKQILLATQNYNGLSGQTSFDANGDVIKPIIIKQIKDGTFIQLNN
jgi:branched-chain amino acid transport system substrate-binding protein